jgi:hypothetical protein
MNRKAVTARCAQDAKNAKVSFFFMVQETRPGKNNHALRAKTI